MVEKSEPGGNRGEETGGGYEEDIGGGLGITWEYPISQLGD